MNTEAILDMQGKLYRWSREDRYKVFADLFNLVCVRSTTADVVARRVRALEESKWRILKA